MEQSRGAGRWPQRPVQAAVAATGLAAVSGNAFIGRDALAWFAALRRPRGMPTMAVFMVVGAAYYAVMATVLARSLQRRDVPAATLSLVVLALNEAWNAAFFGKRSPRNGFAGIVVFAAPLGALRTTCGDDEMSRRLLTAYGAWVAYDLWWTLRLWQLNPTPPRTP